MSRFAEHNSLETRKQKVNTNKHPHSRNEAHNTPATTAQIKLIHTARRDLMLCDSHYRDILYSNCGVRSSKDLTSAQVDKVMNEFYAMGFRPIQKLKDIEKRRHAAVHALEKEAANRLGENWEARLRGITNHCFASNEYEQCTFEQLRRLRAFIKKT